LDFDKYISNLSKGKMKTLSKKICPQCKIEFEYESWNKKKIYCSRICKDIHMSGSRIDTKEYENRAVEKHGNKYSYKLVDLNNKINGKIKIICPHHGEFLQDPSQHLLGKGCKLCARKDQFLTNKEFIDKANKKHNNLYTYDFCNYNSMKEHVIITCKDHGNFTQSPTQHLHHGAGCHICAQIYTSSKGEKDWLDYCNVPDDIAHRQVKIKLENRIFILDGLFENTVYEYLGDFWHGNPNLFLGSEINILAKKSYQDLYLETLQRFDILKNSGYNVKYIWESEWHKIK